MSNNAAVTADGGEIGRAQALQARAARVPPSVHMNPVLLKPQSEIGAQVVVQGKVVRQRQGARVPGAEAQAAGRGARKLRAPRGARPISCWSRARARRRRSTCAPTTSPTWASRAPADVPVVLVGDIDRGGVIASLVGTKAVIDPADAAMIVGFIVNRFRGDPSLFDDGMKTIARRTGWRALGLVPFFDARAPAAGGGRARPAGPKRPAATGAHAHRGAGLSAHRQFRRFRSAAARAERRSRVRAARRSRCPATPRWSSCRGSKATIADLAALREAGWDIDLAAHLRRGGHVLGHLRRLSDAGPHASPIPTASKDRPAASTASACSTSRPCSKATRCWSRSRARPSADGVPFKGYEMHIGRTTGTSRPLLQPRQRPSTTAR